MSRFELSEEQAAAARHRSGVLLLLAGPGTGKTRVVTERVEAMAEEGVPLEDFLCISFTRAAAGEMAQRVAAPRGLDPKKLKGVCRTFHSLGLQILLAERPFKIDKAKPLAGEEMTFSLVSQVRYLGVSIGAVVHQIGLWKKALVGPQEAYAMAATGQMKAFAETYERYQEKLRELGRLDYDDMIFEAVRLLTADADVRSRVTARVKHLAIDEFQDTSSAQQAFAKILSMGAESVLLVGDPNQNIFSFAGANSRVITELSSWFPGYRTLFLKENHRSTTGIVAAYRGAIRGSDDVTRLLIEQLYSSREGHQLAARSFEVPDQEATETVDEIKRFGSAADSAVLFRTNAQSRAFEDTCIDMEVPYVTSSISFYERAEVKLAIAVLGLSMTPDYREPVLCECYGKRRFCGKCEEGVKSVWALRRVAQSRLAVARFLGTKQVDWADKASRSPSMVVFDAPDMTAQKLSSLRAIFDILSGLRHSAHSKDAYQHFVEVLSAFRMAEWAWSTDATAEGDSWKQDNLTELAGVAKRFEYPREFLEYIGRRAMFVARKTPKVGSVTLSTIHKAKGREWESVYVCGLTEGVLPHKRAEDPEEEDRLLYVALSRSRNRLTVSGHGEPSWYLSKALAGEMGFERT